MSTSEEQRLHQQLMGRSTTNSVDPSPIHPSNHTTIIDSLGQTYSSPYHSANALITSSSNLSLHSNHQPPSRLHSIHPIPSQSHPFLEFDPDHQADLLRRRKLEARRSMSSDSNHHSLRPTPSRASFATAPQIRTRRQSNASSIASNATSPLPHQRTLSPQPESRRLLGNGSSLAQVHRPSPLRSASTPTLNPSESEHDPSERPPPVPSLSQKSRQKLMKTEHEKIKKELIESERIRLNIPERRRSIWFNTIHGSSTLIEKENQSNLTIKKVHQEERDPFRKSILQIDGQPDPMKSVSSTSQHQPTSPSSETKESKKKTSSTLSRLFGTLLSTHNHSKSISVVDPRSPILSTSHSNHSKRLTVIQSIKRSTMNKRRPMVPVFDQSIHSNPTPEVFVSSKPSESLEEEDGSGESVPRIGNVKSGNGVMVLVVDSN